MIVDVGLFTVYSRALCELLNLFISFIYLNFYFVTIYSVFVQSAVSRLDLLKTKSETF